MITLATLPQATEQDVFDQVARHLLTQNAKSFGFVCYNEGEMCKYRGDDGRMCAAGCLISDAEYSKDMEGLRFGALHEVKAVPENMQELVDRLQSVHDDTDPSAWPMKLIELAARYELNAQVVQEVLAERERNANVAALGDGNADR